MNLLLFWAGCAVAPNGLLETPDGSGPMVMMDWDAEPLPDIPFPNDLATRPDPTSPTGLRINISEMGDTESESESRQKINEYAGFGIYAPITVAFEAPLDLVDLKSRHPGDVHDPQSFADDAVLVINVDPDSDEYLQPVALDLGNGRYPADIEQKGHLFPNDPRWDAPTMLFETADEDLNGNGVLDWGEDTDNDGRLDTPNTLTVGGDPRGDLLDFYERQTNTLIVRPVVPLREETTYAVVLTDRMVGENGEPVRSPWDFVHHTRQTDALAPVVDGLENLGLGLDNMAFGWVFTTGRVTGDLVDVSRGLREGEGPFDYLAEAYPAGITEAATMHNLPGLPHEYLPTAELIDALVSFDLFGGNAAQMITAAYTQHSSGVVGGTFVAPNLLVDRDDGGTDITDEWWNIDAMTGELSHEANPIVFTCSLPLDDSKPAPVALFGHGHGASRYDFLLMGWAFNRLGIAACAADFPGHGPTVDPELQQVLDVLLEPTGMAPFLEHLNDARFVDIDNDGDKDSGADQWTADPFHTRDMVRQSVVEWIQLVRSLDACGEGTMALPDGTEGVSCDWNGDGVPEMGAGQDVYIYGGSLGGIVTAVAAAVMPEVETFSAIVPGGGLLDIGVRSDLGGVASAVLGRMLSPMMLGVPVEGGLQIVQYVNAFGEMAALPVATLDAIPVGGRIEVENVDLGEVREGYIPDGGTFRLPFAADALDAFEKREVAGIPVEGPEGPDDYVFIEDNLLLGDQLVVRIYDAEGALVETIDSWQSDVVHEGIKMRSGTPLVAGSYGLGHTRQTPEFRRLLQAVALALEPGDPISYARHWFEEPFEELGGEPANILVIPTIGDQGVPISTGVALARAGGLVDWQNVDDRYGMTVDQWLIDREVVRGLEEYGPWADAKNGPILFDPDDLDQGTDGFGAPTEEPLRTVVESDAGISGLRFHYPDPLGRHGYAGEPDPLSPFDAALFAANQVSQYFFTNAQEVADDVCMGTDSCDFIPIIDADHETKEVK